MDAEPWRANSLASSLDTTQADCALRLLKEANNDVDNMTELDKIILRNIHSGVQSMEPSDSMAPTISELLWNGQLDGLPSHDQGDQDRQPVSYMTQASSSESTVSKPTIQGKLRESPGAPSSSFKAGDCWAHVEPRPQKMNNWNKWEPDPSNQEELYLRWQKDMRNAREMKRKAKRGLHT